MKSVVKFFDDYLEHLVCGTCLSVMTGCILLQVILRFFFSQAAAWAEELAIYTMIAAIYFGASLGVKERSHIRIVMLVKCLPKQMQVLSICLADLIWLGFNIFLLVQSLFYLQLLFETTYVLPGLKIEMRWPQSIIPVCLVLMCARMAQVYFHWIRNEKMEGLPI